MGLSAYKAFLGLTAVGLTVATFAPYIVAIARGSLKPHVFSWVIWGATTFVVFLAQLDEDGGAGAWAVGVFGCINLAIALLAYVKRGDATITRTDWWFLIAATLALPLWYLTSEPLWAVVILTIVDLLGFGPTVRRAIEMPDAESATIFALFALRYMLVLLALESYSVATVLFPAAIASAWVGLTVLLVMRRRRKKEAT